MSYFTSFLRQAGIVLGLMAVICVPTYFYNSCVESVRSANAAEKVFTILKAEPVVDHNVHSGVRTVHYTYDGVKVHVRRMWADDFWMPKPGDRAKIQTKHGDAFIVPVDKEDEGH